MHFGFALIVEPKKLYPRCNPFFLCKPKTTVVGCSILLRAETFTDHLTFFLIRWSSWCFVLAMFLHTHVNAIPILCTLVVKASCVSKPMCKAVKKSSDLRHCAMNMHMSQAYLIKVPVLQRFLHMHNCEFIWILVWMSFFLFYVVSDHWLKFKIL